uniref:Uncharacterized protein n=1 Tax=Megaselia scalaris TaxID=36166 RepID=T1GC38_MEGSC
MSMNLDDNGWATIPNMFQIIRLYGNQEPVNLISTSASKGNVSANYGANMSFVSEDTGTNIPSVQITRVQALPSYEFPQTSHNPRDPNQYGRQSAINEMTNQPIASPLILNHPPEHGNQQLFVGSPRFQDPRNLSSFGLSPSNFVEQLSIAAENCTPIGSACKDRNGALITNKKEVFMQFGIPSKFIKLSQMTL